MLTVGSQLDRNLPRREYRQGHLALLGANTVLPFVLKVEPISGESVALFLNGRIAVNTRDFSVNTTAKTITWLSTAPYGIALTDWMEIRYLSKE